MKLQLNEYSFVIFDLDDTLYKEIDFLKSGFSSIIKRLPEESRDRALKRMLEIYHKGEDAFDFLSLYFSDYLPEKSKLLQIYRSHLPEIHLSTGAPKVLEKLKEKKIKIGLITDGRSVTQRNKLKSLGIENFFTEIIISEEFGSEKPSLQNFEYFNNKYLESQFIYIADNPNKDFISPNNLGWLTICILDNGHNIHKQQFSLPSLHLPKFKINSFADLEIIYES